MTQNITIMPASLGEKIKLKIKVDPSNKNTSKFIILTSHIAHILANINGKLYSRTFKFRKVMWQQMNWDVVTVLASATSAVYH